MEEFTLYSQCVLRIQLMSCCSHDFLDEESGALGIPGNVRAGTTVFNPVNDFQPILGESLSFPLNLVSLFNNRGFGKKPSESNFDGYGSMVSIQHVGSDGEVLYTHNVLQAHILPIIFHLLISSIMASL
jgi:hypothetical protein